MSYQSIADVVGCCIGTVKSRIFFAKQSLREEMERQNRVTKLAAAAILFVPIVIMLNQLGMSIDGTTVVLADVAKQLEQVKNCVFKKTVTFTTEEGNVHTNEANVHFAQAGVKQETYRGPNAGL